MQFQTYQDKKTQRSRLFGFNCNFLNDNISSTIKHIFFFMFENKIKTYYSCILKSLLSLRYLTVVYKEFSRFLFYSVTTSGNESTWNLNLSLLSFFLNEIHYIPFFNELLINLEIIKQTVSSNFMEKLTELISNMSFVFHSCCWWTYSSIWFFSNFLDFHFLIWVLYLFCFLMVSKGWFKKSLRTYWIYKLLLFIWC